MKCSDSDHHRTNRSGSLPSVKCIGSEIHYNWINNVHYIIIVMTSQPCMRILMSEWQLQLEFKNGEEFGFFFYVKGDRTFKSLRNNKDKRSTKVWGPFN